MAYQQKENSGSLFQNDKKEKDTHPDSKGSAIIGGVEYWVSAWRKTGSGGKKFLSLAFTKKERPENAAPKREEEPPAPKADPDCPF